MFSVGGDTGLLAGAAFAGGISLNIPFRVTRALPAHALAVVGAGAEQAFVPVAREVVTFAKVSGYFFSLHIPGVAFAFAADAVSSVVAERLAIVVGSAAGLEVAVQLEIVSVALAVPPE